MSRTRKLWKDLSLFGLMALVTGFALLWLAGCNNMQSDQQVKRQAAQTTEQVKAGAQQAAAEAKVAAARAERDVNDIADGVKEGLDGKDSPSHGPSHEVVNINHASEARLVTLPGISPALARKIMNNRPYDSPHDLVSKGVVTEAEYERIAGRLAVWDN
jgi:DNA uptake protein ComE-like DNA-binding protein